MGDPPATEHPAAEDALADESSVPKELRNSLVDYATMFGRMAAGIVPYAGGAISELLTFIPKQRQERAIRFLATLARRMESLDRRFNVQNAMTVDLVESAVMQAARAIRPERNQYLANLLKDCADVQPEQYELDKKILHVLEELTDQDLEVLRSHARFETLARLEHNWPRPRFMSEADRKSLDPKKKFEIEASQISLGLHRDTLVRFDLIRREASKSHISDTGGVLHIVEEKATREFKITTFGRLLLHRVFDEYFD